jgi:general stress protein YciG
MTRPKGSQGFARLSVEQRREIARLGGLAAHKKGTAHRWTSDEASDAGSKGGQHSAVVRAERKKLARANPQPTGVQGDPRDSN